MAIRGNIFISYRRSESLKDARALYERLRREFGENKIFIDLEGIEPGEDFVESLERQLDGCDALVALMAEGWAESRNEHGQKRLDDENDFVRIELGAALRRGVKIFPVLIDGARPPLAAHLPDELKPLVRRQALSLDYAKFDADVVRLARAIRKALDERLLLPKETTTSVDPIVRVPETPDPVASGPEPSEPAILGSATLAPVPQQPIEASRPEELRPEAPPAAGPLPSTIPAPTVEPILPGPTGPAHRSTAADGGPKPADSMATPPAPNRAGPIPTFRPAPAAPDARRHASVESSAPLIERSKPWLAKPGVAIGAIALAVVMTVIVLATTKGTPSTPSGPVQSIDRGNIGAKTEMSAARGSATQEEAPAAAGSAPTVVAAPDDARTIKVGILHSLSGTMAITETPLKDVALMTIDEINAKGGVMGRKLEAVVVDPASNWPLFAEKARGLIAQDKVAVVFGCWTSVARRAVNPVFKELNGLLFFPAQYEGEELEKNVFYTGAAPNQQAIPAVEYLMSKEGGSTRRWVLLGTDFIYPRTVNKILRAFLKSKGVTDDDITEDYTPFGHSDYQTIIAKIRTFSSAGKKTAIVSTINGDSNVPFYRELRNAGIKATDVPVVAFSLGEEELRGIDTVPLVGQLAAWNYFESIKNPVNAEFVRKYKAYAKARNLPNADTVVTSDPMEATYIGIHMWTQAVEKARSTDTDKVIAAMAGQTFKAPDGFTIEMDAQNHHLHKPMFIGEIQPDGQFKVVWKTREPIRAQPWSPYVAGNDRKKDEPEITALK